MPLPEPTICVCGAPLQHEPEQSTERFQVYGCTACWRVQLVSPHGVIK